MGTMCILNITAVAAAAAATVVTTAAEQKTDRRRKGKKTRTGRSTTKKEQKARTYVHMHLGTYIFAMCIYFLVHTRFYTHQSVALEHHGLVVVLGQKYAVAPLPAPRRSLVLHGPQVVVLLEAPKGEVDPGDAHALHRLLMTSPFS